MLEHTCTLACSQGEFPSVNINPFEEYNDYFSSKREVILPVF